MTDIRDGASAKRWAAGVFIVLLITFAILIINDQRPLHRPASDSDLDRYETGKSNLGKLADSVRRFHCDHHRFPTSLDDLAPEYIASVPLDPWGFPFRYRTFPDHVTVCFTGRDGKPGPTHRQVDRDLLITVDPCE